MNWPSQRAVEPAISILLLYHQKVRCVRWELNTALHCFRLNQVIVVKMQQGLCWQDQSIPKISPRT